MKRFKLGSTVCLTRPVNEAREPLRGMTGTVHRILMRDPNCAWVAMDADLPSEFLSFNPPDNRARHIVVAVNECDEVPA